MIPPISWLPGIISRQRRRTDTDIDQAISNVTWHKPPAAGSATTPALPLPGYTSPATSPTSGHPRGTLMRIDTWQCGCIWTWTRDTGWTHDFDCLDAELRRLLDGQH